MKTDFLEVRPIFLRNRKRTEAHVFVAMLALKITRLFQALWHKAFGTTDADPHAMTPEYALQSLARLTYLLDAVKGSRYARLIQPDADQRALLDALGIHFPRQTAKAIWSPAPAGWRRPVRAVPCMSGGVGAPRPG